MAGEADRDTDSKYHCDDGDEGKRLGLVGQKTAIQFIRHGRQGRQTQPADDTILLSNGTQRGVRTVASPPYHELVLGIKHAEARSQEERVVGEGWWPTRQIGRAHV